MTLEERSQMTDTERIDGSSVAVTAEVPDTGKYNWATVIT